MSAMETTVAKADARSRGGADAGLLRQSRRVFLPRPWLEVEAGGVLTGETLDSGSGDGGADESRCQYLHRAGATVYVKGAVTRRGQPTIRLAYWHQVATF